MSDWKLFNFGNPVEFQKNVIRLNQDQVIARTELLKKLVQSLGPHACIRAGKESEPTKEE